MPTQKGIAKAPGISQGAVSLALRGERSMSASFGAKCSRDEKMS